MGDASPAVEKSARNAPPEMRVPNYFSDFFYTYSNFAFSNIFKIKWPKSEEKLNFGDRWVWLPMNPSPPNIIFVAAPLTWTPRTEPPDASCTDPRALLYWPPYPSDPLVRPRLTFRHPRIVTSQPADSPVLTPRRLLCWAMGRSSADGVYKWDW